MWRAHRHPLIRLAGPLVCVLLMASVAGAQGDRVSGLIADLASEDPGVRLSAARDLASLAVWEAAEPLVSVLADPDEDVRDQAVSALEQIGEGAVDAVLEGLKSEVPGIRAGCADVLGRMTWSEDVRIGSGLLSVVDDPHPKVRFMAVEALGSMGDPLAADALRKALADPDPSVRVLAASALTRLGDGSGLPLLLKASTDADPEIRGISVGGLARIATPPALQALRDLTSDEDPTIRRFAFTSLLSIGTPETVRSGLEGLKDPSRNVRTEVAHTLGVFQPPGVADALLETLQSDESVMVRVTAGNALGSIGDQRAEPILLERLGPEYRDIERAGAADALGWLASQAAIKPLTELLEDEDARVRRAARLSLRLILEECPDCP
jgi:HEAT repeat protein